MGNPTTRYVIDSISLYPVVESGLFIRASRLDYSITQADVPLLRGDNFPATPLSPTSPGDDIKKASDAELDLPAKVDITNGRPDLKLILKEEIELARGSVAVKGWKDYAPSYTRADILFI
jgi:hypothetical protein